MIIQNWTYLTQRDNTDIDLETFLRKPNKSTQCMVSSFSMWLLQFGHFIENEKWKNEWNEKSAEEILYLLVMTYTKNSPENDTRFMSEVFRKVIDPMLDPLGWKMQVKRNYPELLADVLDTGQGVVVGTNISSFLKGASGHIQYFIGYEKDVGEKLTGFYSCDPYGDCRDGYKTRTLEKGFVFYPIETINRLLTPFGKDYPTLCSYAVKK